MHGDAGEEAVAMAPPRSKVDATWRQGAAWIPAVAFVGVATMSVGFHHLVGPTIDRVAVPSGSLDSPQEAAGFASAATLWAAASVVGFLTIATALAIAIGTIVEFGFASDASARRRIHCRAWLVGLALLGVLALAVELFVVGAPPLFDLRLSGGAHAMGFEIHWPMSTGNALMVTTVAALFGGGAALILAATDRVASARRDGVADDARLQARLSLLVGVGAVATVVGVLNVISLYRLPAALVSTGDPERDGQIVAALHGLASHVGLYWGAIFTTALVLLILPVAAAIGTDPSDRDAPADDAAVGTTPWTRWIRFATALSPLALAGFGQLVAPG